MPLEPPNLPSGAEGGFTGLPLLSTWPRLYAFVLVFCVLCVLVLLWLSRAFA